MKAAVHVMVVNFFHEEVELPKGTVLCVAEEVSENLVAAVNEGPVSEPGWGTPKVKIDASFRKKGRKDRVGTGTSQVPKDILRRRVQ